MASRLRRVFHLRTASSSAGIVDALWEWWESGSDTARPVPKLHGDAGVADQQFTTRGIRMMHTGKVQAVDIHISFLIYYYFF